MKVAIVHLSDFHIHDKDRLLNQKINGILTALNAIGNVDEYIVVFSGYTTPYVTLTLLFQANPPWAAPPDGAEIFSAPLSGERGENLCRLRGSHGA